MTPARCDVLYFIKWYCDLNGYGPTVRDITAYRKRSSATIQQHINSLLHDKYLFKIKDGVFARNYRLTVKAIKLFELRKSLLENYETD